MRISILNSLLVTAAASAAATAAAAAAAAAAPEGKGKWGSEAREEERPNLR